MEEYQLGPSFLRQTKESIGGIDHLTSIDLKKLHRKWKQVVVDYSNQEGHQEFIKLCQENGALPFAIYRYNKMLEIDKEDELAPLMARQALSRLSLHFHRDPYRDLQKVSRSESFHQWIESLRLLIMKLLRVGRNG